MDLIRIIEEHIAVGFNITGFNQGDIAWVDTPSSVDLALSAALIDEHIEDISTYINSNLNTACPTVKSLASGAQWAAYIVQQKKIGRKFAEALFRDSKVLFLYFKWFYADAESDPNAGDYYDEFYAELENVITAYPEGD